MAFPVKEAIGLASAGVTLIATIVKACSSDDKSKKKKKRKKRR